MKKAFTILLVGVLVLCLGACSGGDTSSIGDSRTPPVEQGETTPTQESSTLPVEKEEVSTTRSQEEKELIDEQLQGTWMSEVKGENSDEVLGETYFTFDNGKLTAQMIIGDVESPITEGSYSIEYETITVNDGTLEYTFETDILTLYDPITKSEVTRSEGPILTQDVWEMRYFEDEFGEPTQDGYVTTESYVQGTFSNSATTNSLLLAAFIADAEDLSIALLEYGSSFVGNSSNQYNESYNITMRTSDDTRHEMNAVLYPGGTRMIIDDVHRDTVIEALSGTGSVDFYIVQSERPTTTYLFTLELANFSEVYQNLIQE